MEADTEEKITSISLEAFSVRLTPVRVNSRVSEVTEELFEKRKGNNRGMWRTQLFSLLYGIMRGRLK